MEKIKNISISNFKSIKQATIEDCARINLFVGYPNTGKSNILEAMSLFMYNDSNPQLKDIIRIKTISNLFQAGNTQKPIAINFNQNYNLNYNLISSDRGILSLQNEQNTLILDRNFGINNSNLTGQRFFDNLLTVKKYTYKSDINYQDESKFELKAPHGDNFPQIVEQYKELRADLGELLKAFGLKFHYDKVNNEFNLLKETDEYIYYTIPIDQIADSLRRLMFHKAAICSNKQTALLFEEPEAHVFPPYIRKLTYDIKNDKQDNIFFITTHSSDILQDFIEETEISNDVAIYVVSYQDETKIKKISQEDMTRIREHGIDLIYNLENFE